MDVLLLTLKNAVYAVRKDEVADVRPCPPLFRPPLTPKEMAGVVSLDGRTCVLADLSAALGSEPLARKDGLVALILDAESELPGFVLSDMPQTLTLPEPAKAELPMELQSDICSSWIAHDGGFAPILNLVALQQLLIRGDETDTSKAQQLLLPDAGDHVTTNWQVMLHGKPFAIAAQRLRKVEGEAVLAPLYSLPDFIPALLLDEGHVLPCCDLAGLLLDAPLASATIWVADLGLSSIAFWVDEDTQPQSLSGEIHLLAPLVARRGLGRALVSSGQVYPLIDLAVLLAVGLSWHRSRHDDQLLALERGSWEAVVEISLSGARYALPRGVVASEMPVLEITPLPAAPAIIRGLSLFEGELLPVFDFTPYFGRRAEVTAQSRLLLIKERGFKALLLVDELLQGRQLGADAHRQLPFHLKESLVCGCYVDQKAVVLVLDPLAMACSFREEIVRDFRKHLVASGLVGRDESDVQGDWWEVHTGIEAEEPGAEQDSQPESGEASVAVAAVATSMGTPQESGIAPSETFEPDQDFSASTAESSLDPPAVGDPAPQAATEEREQGPEDISAALPGGSLDEALQDIAPNLLFDAAEISAVTETTTAAPDTVVAQIPPGRGQERLAAGIASDPAAVDGTAADIKGKENEPAQDVACLQVGPDELGPEAPQVEAHVSAALTVDTPDVTDLQESTTEPPGEGIPEFPENLGSAQKQHDEDNGCTGGQDDQPFGESGDVALAQPAEDTPDSRVDDGDGEEGTCLLERSSEALVEEIVPAGEEGRVHSELPPDTEPAAALENSFDDALREEAWPGESTRASEMDRDDIVAKDQASRGILWSHAGGQELSQQPLPHVQPESHVTARKLRAGRLGAVLCAVLLLLVASWWFLPSVLSPPPGSETPVVPQEPVKLVAQSAPAPAAADLQGKAAEPRIPQAVSDANLGHVAQEQITIVIPAELLKSSLDPRDLEIVISWGDTLWEIAERYTGNPWNYRRIARENNIRNPNLIFPRQKLNIRTEE